jgi:hypothetical protein
VASSNVDTGILVRAWLLGQSSITSLLGTNQGGSIYAAPDLPKNFDPSLGAGIQIFTAGGPPPHSEIPTIVDEKIQVKIWANVEQYTLAKTVYLAVQTVMRGACGVDLNPNGFVIRCLELTPGQEITDPDTGWATVLAFYLLMARIS